MERAASSKSLNILGVGFGVWEITDRVAESTFSTASQHGQTTSNNGGFFAMP
jgi:hypothetical protein